MRGRLLGAPWWVLSLYAGVGFGVLFGIATALLPPGGWVWGVVAGVGGGIFFGALMGPWLAAQHRRALAAVGPLSLDQRRAALRAASRGPAPADPAVRAAAAHLVSDRLHTASRQRGPMTIFFGAFLVLEVVSAILGNPWLWLAVAGIAALLVVVRRNPVWLCRRLDRLRPTG